MTLRKYRYYSVSLFSTCILTMPLLCYGSSLTSSNTHSINREGAININAIDWCPQLCNHKDQQGYVMDTVNAVFIDSPYYIVSTTYPWSRAIQGVFEGKALALLSPAKSEAPGLRFPNNPIGVQRMCFFASRSSSWQYEGLESLEGLRIGIAYDTSIAELNDYVTHNKGQFSFFPYDDDFITRNLNMVKQERLDTFLFTYNSTMYTIAQLGMGEEIKSAGCVSAEAIYMAFSPDPEQAEKVDKLIEYFDTKMGELRKTDAIDTIMKKYGLIDWQPYL
ncbi:hypothetical protein L4D20_20045 [Vibrio kyushuensis]|uniref:substrate-binding periplasmic protein n=1 Tax=Vibrio kyushuensis TaxID=2910249 RepID=UPI003D143ED7